jgi:hypothetical protein
MEYYNGYSPRERDQKLRAMYRQFPNRSHPYYQGPCDLYGDPDSPVEPHTEDYSMPYLWERPAEYAVCKTCHRRIHSRFRSPRSWEAYKRHVRRGGYGADLKYSGRANEVTRLARALEHGESVDLETLRQAPTSGSWWEALNCDPKTLTGPASRPR